MDDDEAQAAKDILNAQIKTYYEAVSPGDYVSDWVLITHRQSIALAQEDNSAVGVLTPTGQSFVTTRGLLAIGAEVETLSFEEEDD